MASSLSDLPLELINRIVDYLPNRDALLQLRQTSKCLCAKTLEQFSKAYFATSFWTLGGSNTRAICHFATRPLVVAHLASITLEAPTRDRTYDDFWKAKKIDPASLATALNRFTYLRSLKLEGFREPAHDDGWSFMKAFISHLATNDLEKLELYNVDLTQNDAVNLVKKFHRTLKAIVLSGIDIVFRPSTERKKHRYYSPWAEVLTAMECFSNNCEVTIDTPMVDGDQVDMVPPWEDWYGGYEWKGLSIELERDEDSFCDNCADWTEPDEQHAVIHISGDSDWQKGVNRVCAFYLVVIIPLHENSYDLEEDDWGRYEMSDKYWDRNLKELLQTRAGLELIG